MGFIKDKNAIKRDKVLATAKNLASVSILFNCWYNFFQTLTNNYINPRSLVLDEECQFVKISGY